VVLATGGTGGHVFPAQALARALEPAGYRVVVVTDDRGGGYQASFPDLEIHKIRAASPAGGLGAKVRAAVAIGAGLLGARALLRRLDPAVVVGFGGYPSYPTVKAALGQGRPTLLHEQNAVLGRVNRHFAPKVSGLALSFPGTRNLRPQDEAKAQVTGNPVREAVRAVRAVPYTPPNDGALRLVVIGGSQGANVMSRVVPDALNGLSAKFRDRLRVTQQCRPEDLEGVRALYGQAGITADLDTFFADLPALLAGAHVVIARAGASTVAELGVAGRPAILVPLPAATDDHQTANARALVAAGGAWLMAEDRFDPATCRRTLEALFAEPQTLAEMAAGAHELGRADAARELARLVDRLAGRNGEPAPDSDHLRRAAA